VKTTEEHTEAAAAVAATLVDYPLDYAETTEV
jgi:hypothetical protein